MPKLSWYLKRLAKMSPQEVLLMRVGRACRDRLPARPPRAPRHLYLAPFESGLRGCLAQHFPTLESHVCAQADGWLAGRTTLFGKSIALPAPLDWQRDPLSGQRWPREAARTLNYRDLAAGDPKDVWELNRHTILPCLGLAYFLSGEPRYAAGAQNLIQSWIVQNPPRFGINWTSHIEAAIRLVNWLLALRLLAARAPLTAEFEAPVAASMMAQADEIARHLSLYSSANNHLIAELCGLAQAGAALGRAPWLNLAAKGLAAQVTRQIHEDGVGAEQSPHYLAHTLDFYALALLAFKQAGWRHDPAIERRLEKGAAFLAALLNAEGVPPAFGDSDSGVILTLGEACTPYQSTLHLLGGLLPTGPAIDESVANDWRLAVLCGPKHFRQALAQSREPRPAPVSRHFPEGGVSILEVVLKQGPVRLVFDAGPLGLPPLYGHGHADALSFVLDDGGLPLLVDPGTYAYFKHPAWRRYFRSSAAHNTIRVDASEQSVLAGPFFAECPARTRQLSRGATHIEAEHNGYRRLPRPLTHRRRATFTPEALLVDDYLLGRGEHDIELNFHFDSRVRVERDDDGFLIHGTRRDWRLSLDPRLTVSVYYGEEAAFYGWQSRVLNDKEPATSLVARLHGACPLHLTTRLWPLSAPAGGK